MNPEVQVTIPTEQILFDRSHPLARLSWAGVGIGVLALVGAFLISVDPRQFLFSYLTSVATWLTVALGALIFVLLQFVTRAGWSVVVRRTAEHLAASLPLFFLLILPLLGNLDRVFPWADPAMAHEDHLIHAKSGYLNVPFFTARTVVYFAVWCALAWWFRRHSLRQDEVGSPLITRRLQNLSAPGILLYGVTLQFFAFDWLMSLDPHWYSTIFGVYVFAGAMTSGLAAVILLLHLLRRWGLIRDLVTTEHLHDLGKLLFGFVVFWAYIAFSQFMLIWYANLTEETIWYAHRWRDGWQGVSVLLAVGHFVLPFFFLLSRETKRNPRWLGLAAAWMLLMHWVDLYWLVMPNLHSGFHPHAADLLAWLGTAGFTLAVVLRLALGKNLVPTRDPRLAESLVFENL